MKKLLLLSALAASGLTQAADAIPDVVKQFSEQQQQARHFGLSVR